MAYMGRKSCGCVVTISWIEPRFKKDAEDDAQRYRDAGMTVEHVTADVARTALKHCPHDERQHKVS